MHYSNFLQQIAHVLYPSVFEATAFILFLKTPIIFLCPRRNHIFCTILLEIQKRQGCNARVLIDDSFVTR